MPDTSIDLQFADGTYHFWLALPQFVELERKTEKSVFAIYDSIASGLGLDNGKPVYIGGSTASVNDIRETIRLALIGGNSGEIDGEEVEVGPIRARQLVDTYCYPERPLVEGMHVAWAVLRAAIEGVELKKKADQPETKNQSDSIKES